VGEVGVSLEDLLPLKLHLHSTMVFCDVNGDTIKQMLKVGAWLGDVL